MVKYKLVQKKGQLKTGKNSKNSKKKKPKRKQNWLKRTFQQNLYLVTFVAAPAHFHAIFHLFAHFLDRIRTLSTRASLVSSWV